MSRVGDVLDGMFVGKPCPVEGIEIFIRHRLLRLDVDRRLAFASAVGVGQKEPTRRLVIWWQKGRFGFQFSSIVVTTAMSRRISRGVSRRADTHHSECRSTTGDLDNVNIQNVSSSGCRIKASQVCVFQPTWRKRSRRGSEHVTMVEVLGRAVDVGEPRPGGEQLNLRAEGNGYIRETSYALQR